jgi:phenylacetic acid degradation operon negative regulatory protein
VLLSVLLGSHPPQLPVRVLVRLAELFGIAEGTVRVALSRLSADGDVVGDGGTYELSARHLSRQRDQDAALRPPTRAWDGRWELLSGPSVDALAAHRRMARLRPGLWLRPDNLSLPPPGLDTGSALWVASLAAGSVPASSELWDLTAWAATARNLTGSLESAHAPADRLAIAAAIVRHLRSDPLLPAELVPPSWPGPELRTAYDAYRAELGQLIRALRDS